MAGALKVAAAAAALAVALTGCAVVPTYTVAGSTFDGFPVISHIPSHPTGLVFLFHGTGGSANFATKLETVDMLNHLTAAGYGFVSTDSTNRTSKQWDNTNLSLTSNPDLARLSRLYASYVASGSITKQTPIYAIGMSQGAGFASVFATAFKNAGYPVAAIAPSHGQIPVTVRNSGGLHVPALFALGANDPIVNNAQVLNQVAQVVRDGGTASAYVEPETSLQAVRFVRVPGIDPATANAVFAALVDAGLYDRSGHRLVTTAKVDAALASLTLPTSLTKDQKLDLGQEVDVVMAVHEYSATYANQTVAFFGAHR